MDYQGRYPIFDPSSVQTYPLRERVNKVSLDDLINPDEIAYGDITVNERQQSRLQMLAREIVRSVDNGWPVIVFTGAHLIKNGLGPILGDLVNRGVVSLVAGNAATAIHDFELALIGETSEYVPDGLEKGRFGMASEFSLINGALTIGNRHKLGFGESLGMMITDGEFRDKVLDYLNGPELNSTFQYPGQSLLGTCYNENVPLTIHTGIGTDVIDQHPSFDGEAKGGCSGRDFLIFVAEVLNYSRGGVFLNIGSAVTGPEVLLKAVSMAANAGYVPRNIVTGDFDMRDNAPEKMADETSPYYYFRDQKSVVTRVPEAYDGEGVYVQGDMQLTLPAVYQFIMKELEASGSVR